RTHTTAHDSNQIRRWTRLQGASPFPSASKAERYGGHKVASFRLCPSSPGWVRIWGWCVVMCVCLCCARTRARLESTGLCGITLTGRIRIMDYVGSGKLSLVLKWALLCLTLYCFQLPTTYLTPDWWTSRINGSLESLPRFGLRNSSVARRPPARPGPTDRGEGCEKRVTGKISRDKFWPRPSFRKKEDGEQPPPRSFCASAISFSLSLLSSAAS
ncbi:hypothetical protein MAPG_00969, partial [Magnaporthiopsis poae ATCC 64411]|uniref:Uncharacterized protein n=1 Tax=Magnaporthiopsis poae (strain ATCC 64411 / 73-15) TaxID=644358 RepID=A0A0C4DMG2_MAGP6